eukprot:CAMPEP_0172308770 /NCGR_PEP_ID=MMETSP1058-20130122/9271_1 /TAXON_ID=83371 /ORGANISM="Detonula confervacea, Strain CCMP 353" /LENGTH=347 /DNA_ID=CAMNT_0013021265 /DNA_START=236 /DNA_END=1277 /DNA_ORIENTATION=+
MATTGSIPNVYPLSRKKVMLIEESKKLNATRGSYSSIGWSNRHGSVLTPASIPGVYTADRPFYWNKIDVSCRMTIIQLQSSSSGGGSELVVHSPVGLDPPLIEALEKLGTVAHVISPNYEHVKYAYQWAEQYPNAKMWGCPGLMERKPDVRWTGEIPYGARPPGFAKSATADGGSSDQEMWDWEELQPLHIDTEANPFTGKPFFNEVVYYHAPSKSLLTTDLYWNYPRGDGVTNGQVTDELAAKGIKVENEDGDFGVWELAPNVGDIPLGSRVWGKVGMDKLFYPFYMNLMVKSDRRDEFKEIARYITCDGWEVETIIPAHGDIVRGKELCRKVLEQHFNINAHRRR